jgi:hypothetical protein
MTNRSVVVFTTLLLSATTAQAGNQLFEGSWTVKAFGNEITGGTTGRAEFYSAYGIPLGIQCNDRWPRCPFQSTPTDGSGMFNPVGGIHETPPQTFCAPWGNWMGGGATARPAKGGTARTGQGNPIPPLYRNYAFFTTMTPSAQPNLTYCNATSTDGMGGPGALMLGNPVTGRWSAVTTGTQHGGFNFAAALAPPAAGVRTTGQIGEFPRINPYSYRYTYATLRNDQGAFGPGQGPGAFSFTYTQSLTTTARINVKQGAARFGGTMQMLGALTAKICYYRNGGCSRGVNNWRFDAVGATADTSLGVVTAGKVATYRAYYHITGLMTTYTNIVVGARFPWTTGSVTIVAPKNGTGFPTRRTIHYAHGYDNRNTTTPSGLGTIQLVTPVMTRLIVPNLTPRLGGIGILRIKFIPEPQMWTMLVAGVAILGVGYRMRGR